MSVRFRIETPDLDVETRRDLSSTWREMEVRIAFKFRFSSHPNDSLSLATLCPAPLLHSAARRPREPHGGGGLDHVAPPRSRSAGRRDGRWGEIEGKRATLKVPRVTKTMKYASSTREALCSRGVSKIDLRSHQKFQWHMKF